jgi:hypothetical protein
VQSLQDLLIDSVVVDESASSGGLGSAIKSWPGWIKHSVIKNSSFEVNPHPVSGSTDISPMEMWNWETDCEVYNNIFKEGFISLAMGRTNGGTRALNFHDNNLINTSPVGAGHELALDDVDFHDNYVTGQALGIWAASHTYNLDGISNVRVYRNVFHKGSGQSIVIQHGPTAVPFDNIQVYNNVFDGTDQNWPNTGVVISANLGTGNFTNFKIINNIFLNTDYGIGFNGNASLILNPIVRYNDFFRIGVAQIYDAGVTSPSFSNNLTVDPRFTATGNRPMYYTLAADSSLIDAGTNVGLPYNGSAPDIGAIENTP